MQSYFRQRTCLKLFYVRKIRFKKIRFVYLQKTRFKYHENPDPHITNAKHCEDGTTGTGTGIAKDVNQNF
jgi:hypothetical protein